MVAGALEGDSVLKFCANRCDFAMTLVARSGGKTSFEVSAKRVAFVAAGGEGTRSP